MSEENTPIEEDDVVAEDLGEQGAQSESAEAEEHQESEVDADSQPEEASAEADQTAVQVDGADVSTAEDDDEQDDDSNLLKEDDISVVEPNPQLAKILEGAIMASGEPLSITKMQTLFIEAPDKDVIEATLAEIQRNCEGRGFGLVEVASGWRFQVREEIAIWVNRLWEEKPQKYSRALLETLALIAYRQPITRGDIEEVRGVAVSSNIIKTLTERDWVKVVGHRDVPGRPALYATTRIFLDYFNLKSLDELPTLGELKDIDGLNNNLDFSANDGQTDAGDSTDESAATDETAEGAAADTAATGDSTESSDEDGSDESAADGSELAGQTQEAPESTASADQESEGGGLTEAFTGENTSLEHDEIDDEIVEDSGLSEEGSEHAQEALRADALSDEHIDIPGSDAADIESLNDETADHDEEGVDITDSALQGETAEPSHEEALSDTSSEDVSDTELEDSDGDDDMVEPEETQIVARPKASLFDSLDNDSAGSETATDQASSGTNSDDENLPTEETKKD